MSGRTCIAHREHQTRTDSGTTGEHRMAQSLGQKRRAIATGGMTNGLFEFLFEAESNIHGVSPEAVRKKRHLRL